MITIQIVVEQDIKMDELEEEKLKGEEKIMQEYAETYPKFAENCNLVLKFTFGSSEFQITYSLN